MIEHPFGQFAVALLIGALVGLEREKRKAIDGKLGIGGIRTFLLLAQAGAIAAFLSRELGSHIIFVGAGALVTLLVVAGYREDVRQHPADYGLTTEIAALVVFLLGGMVLYGHVSIAVGLAIASLAALAWKEPLHAFIDGLDQHDMFAGLKLLIATFIVLPVLPDRTLDPWGAVNPYKIWLLVVLISGLSLVGYVLARWLGEQKGLAITGLVGGLVSSTAVTLAFARRSREDDAGTLSGPLASGIILAWAVMFVRIAVIAGVILPALAWHVGPTAAVLALVCIAFAWTIGRSPHDAQVSVPLTNPFSLTSAMRFAELFTGVLLVVKLGEHYLPARALYGVAFVAGLTDVDAITLSMAEFAQHGGAVATAAIAIWLAALSNTLFKCGLVVSLGRKTLARHIVVASVLIAVIAAVTVSLTTLREPREPSAPTAATAPAAR